MTGSMIKLEKGKNYRVLPQPALPILSITTRRKGSRLGSEFITTTSQALVPGTVIQYCGKVEDSRSVGEAAITFSVQNIEVGQLFYHRMSKYSLDPKEEEIHADLFEVIND